jgi:hypothetical protein
MKIAWSNASVRSTGARRTRERLSRIGRSRAGVGSRRPTWPGGIVSGAELAVTAEFDRLVAAVKYGRGSGETTGTTDVLHPDRYEVLLAGAGVCARQLDPTDICFVQDTFANLAAVDERLVPIVVALGAALNWAQQR